MSELKMKAAKAALQFIKEDMVVGVGTGSTVNFFIKELATIKHKIDACVSSSKATEALLRKEGIPVIDLNSVQELPIYIDGADEVTEHGEMIKGGGGAHTREKIVAQLAEQFICIVDDSKLVKHLGRFPVAVEVIPLARSMVARQLVTLGGDPEYREGFITDNGNIILDVYNLTINEPLDMEDRINRITGVVENGIFAHRTADVVLLASQDGVKRVK
ncbi:ribose-5-phosphate isomerase RpiA [Legionella sp. PATHC035]|uniref:ribose-5-phosphate isomerase RpiA n=1 Tax=Legionella sp. PATHC035 TaxID=2992040 RepID=UPI0022433703|nr:ribose-5-phosphate isomerase RpiA [Legionella sp. PATHC035]MCW8408979.1 ribose-5-phosphate isomerase RpiA [Legionella sp. PATHC035]